MFLLLLFVSPVLLLLLLLLTCDGASAQNGGSCVDGVNDYSCTCPGEYTGKFCEVTPMALMYPQTSPCAHHDCKHGICFQPPGSSDYVCKCSPGEWGGGARRTDLGADLVISLCLPHLSVTYSTSTLF